MEKQKINKVIVTCGYREEYPDGTIKYYGGETDNGVCYKDLDAWNSGEGVCYLCEGDFLEQDNDDNEWVFALGSDSSFPNTRDDIMDLMSEYLAGCDVKLIEQCAEYALETCDWQCLDTLMGEANWEEEVREVYSTGSEVFWLDPTGEASQVYEIDSVEGPEMVKLSNEYSECEALLCEVYRKADGKFCKHCGNILYHEKYNNTQDHYPYVCFECDENFFEIETN